MALNTRIRGQQINLADEAIDVTADSIAFKDADGAIKVEAVDDLVTALAGTGLANDSSTLKVDLNELSDVAINVGADYLAFIDNDDNVTKKESIVDLVTAMAGDGLSTDADGVLDVEVDDSTIEISGDAIQVKDGGITEPKLAMNNAPADGKVIAWNAGGSYMEWVDPDVNAVQNADIQVENESANCNGVTTDFTLDNTPVANSVQVFLNGLLQEEGSGKDYTLSGTTVSFATAPETGDILIIHYIISD